MTFWMFMIMKLAPDDHFHGQRGWWDVQMWIAFEVELNKVPAYVSIVLQDQNCTRYNAKLGI